MRRCAEHTPCRAGEAASQRRRGAARRSARGRFTGTSSGHVPGTCPLRGRDLCPHGEPRRSAALSRPAPPPGRAARRRSALGRAVERRAQLAVGAGGGGDARARAGLVGLGGAEGQGGGDAVLGAEGGVADGGGEIAGRDGAGAAAVAPTRVARWARHSPALRPAAVEELGAWCEGRGPRRRRARSRCARRARGRRRRARARDQMPWVRRRTRLPVRRARVTPPKARVTSAMAP